SRYRSLFESIVDVAKKSKRGGVEEVAGSAMACLKDLDSVKERFDAADAISKVTAARASVADAFDRYQRRAGEHDDQLAGLFRKLLEGWDVVGMSPIFVKHHVLRQELGTLSVILQQIVDA